MAERGRPKGKESKNTKFLLNRLQDMYGEDFDPIMMAAKNAYEMNGLAQLELTKEQMEDMEAADLIRVTEAIFNRKRECVNAFDKISQYVNPKLKAIEVDMTVKGDKENPIEIKHGLDDELAEQLYRDLCDNEDE